MSPRFFGHLRELLVHKTREGGKAGQEYIANGQKAQALLVQPKLRAGLPAQGPAVPVPQPAAYEQHLRQDGHVKAQAIGEHVERSARGFAIAQPAAVRALYVQAQQRLARSRAEKVQAERLKQQHKQYRPGDERHRDAEAREVDVRPEDQHDGREKQQFAEYKIQCPGKVSPPAAGPAPAAASAATAAPAPPPSSPGTRSPVSRAGQNPTPHRTLYSRGSSRFWPPAPLSSRLPPSPCFVLTLW